MADAILIAWVDGFLTSASESAAKLAVLAEPGPIGGTTPDTVNSTTYNVNGTKVIGAQENAIASATDVGSTSGSDTVDSAAINNYLAEHEDRINLILAALRAHGLIAT